MITEESKPGQSVTSIELEEDDFFIEVRQEKDKLEIIIPSTAHRSNLLRVYGVIILTICMMLTFLGIPIIAFGSTNPFVFKIFFLLIVLVLNVLLIGSMLSIFGRTTLRFTHSRLRIERQFAFFHFCRRISLNQVGEASCEMYDDLYINWPEDIVMIPLGKNDCYNIFYIKTYDDQKYLANVINTFLTQNRQSASQGDAANVKSPTGV